MSELPTKMESADDADDLVQYQAVSISAVLALVLGIISPLAFLSPILILIPTLAIVVAIVAFSKLRDSSGLTGARLARIGMALAIVFGIASCSRITVINILVNRARARMPVAEPISAEPSEEPIVNGTIN